MAGAKRSADPICSSCYRGFLPVVDHLRSLSARGHAFHEPCIQHLFASCWKEEMSYCPISQVNVRRLKSHSVVNSCHCGDTLEELRQEVKQLKRSLAGMSSGRKFTAEWSRRYRRRETMRRLHDVVMRLQLKVMRLEHLQMQKDCADVAKELILERKVNITVTKMSLALHSHIQYTEDELKVAWYNYRCEFVPLRRKPCDPPIRGNFGLHDRCSRKASIGTTMGQCYVDLANTCNKCESAKTSIVSPSKRNKKGSDNLKADSMETGPPLIFSPSKINKKGSDNLKADSMETGPPLGSIPTPMTQCNDTEDPYSVQRCLAIVNGMQGLDPSLHIAAQDLFENPSWRKIFVSLKREKRLTWLISMLPGV